MVTYPVWVPLFFVGGFTGTRVHLCTCTGTPGLMVKPGTPEILTHFFQ